MTRSNLQPGPETGHYHDTLGVDQDAPSGASLFVDNGVDPPTEVTTLVAPGADVSGDEARVQGLDPHNGLLVSFDDESGLAYALRVHYSGDPIDYIPLVEIGDGDVGKKVLVIDSSGDADWFFRDSGVSLIFHRASDGKQILKVSDEAVLSGPFVVDVDGERVYVTNLSGSGILLEVRKATDAILMALPSVDPGVAGQLYTDGVPSAGVSKALRVSGG